MDVAPVAGKHSQHHLGRGGEGRGGEGRGGEGRGGEGRGGERGGEVIIDSSPVSGLLLCRLDTSLIPRPPGNETYVQGLLYKLQVYEAHLYTVMTSVEKALLR